MNKKIILLTVLFSFSAISSPHDPNSTKQFLLDFHANTKKVMDEIPPKIGNNVPLTLEQPNFLDDRNSTRDLIMTSSNPIIAPRFSIDTRVDDPANLVDSGYQLLRNLNALHSIAPLSKRLEQQPWSDSYWPLYSGGIAYRYADKEIQGQSWQQFFDFSNFIKPIQSYVGSERDQLSPAEKYDLLVGDNSFSLTQSSWGAGKQYFDSTGRVERWMGLCHGWAAASYMLPRPKRTVKTISKTGEKITFYPSDIKALGTLLWAQSPFNTKFIGGRCNIKDPQKDANGRIINQECIDTNPASWHLSIMNQIGLSERSLIMDATYDYQVWNQPVIGYDVVFFNPQSFQTSLTPAESTIAIQHYHRDKFPQYRSPNATSIVGVEMTVEYMVETNQSHKKYDRPSFDGIAKVTYYYDLELDANGNAIGGEWYQNKHPDFLWTPTPNAKAVSYKEVEGSWDITKPIPEHWEEAAKSSAQYFQPLSSIVNTLFKHSSVHKENNWQQLVTRGAICLDVEGGYSFIGIRVIGWPCHGSDNQLWKFDRHSRLKSKLKSDLCLDQKDGNVFLNQCSNHESQRWTLTQGALTNTKGEKLLWSANSSLITIGKGEDKWVMYKPSMSY